VVVSSCALSDAKNVTQRSDSVNIYGALRRLLRLGFKNERRVVAQTRPVRFLFSTRYRRTGLYYSIICNPTVYKSVNRFYEKVRAE